MNHVTERTRAHILQSFQSLLEDKGFEDISIKMVCEASKIHRSSFYRYYIDKYDLFEDLLRLITEELYVLIEEENQSFFEVFIDYVSSREKIARHLFDNNNETFNYFVKLASKLMLEQAKIQRSPFTKKINEAKFPEIVCDFYSSGIIQIIKKWLGRQYSMTKEELKNFIYDETKGFD
ncbi:TetR/AcrR family transcriptional regulator [Cohnella faecalis]|uniref:TetR/AcrR family transcriptional regulator n=1 Tax=Cohnella faecalis TaxID=2315694 RepID=A0A398CQB5_9BACL|nr:TetR/AcrR family transcriptional regulator [Cohnella faecalis]RIE01174.1 TetR/AcrR family transcriptional regulator [Cohnella faecalis]